MRHLFKPFKVWPFTTWKLIRDLLRLKFKKVNYFKIFCEMKTIKQINWFGSIWSNDKYSDSNILIFYWSNFLWEKFTIFRILISFILIKLEIKYKAIKNINSWMNTIWIWVIYQTFSWLLLFLSFNQPQFFLLFFLHPFWHLGVWFFHSYWPDCQHSWFQLDCQKHHR